MKEICLTPDQLEEINRLQQSEYVKIARKEQRLKYKKRQYLYLLRNLEKRGKQLAEDGITLDNLEEQIAEIDYSTESMKEAETV